MIPRLFNYKLRTFQPITLIFHEKKHEINHQDFLDIQHSGLEIRETM